MKTVRSEQLAKLEIDAEQWQRDIRTFAETTNQALHAIVSQLSNCCSNGHRSSNNQNPTPFNGQSQIAGSTRLPQSKSSPPIEARADSSIAASQIGDQDRLSNLKSQLAQRISRSR